MLKKYLLLIVFALLVFISSSAFAQGGEGPPAPAGAPGDCIGCPPANPIDGGLGFLLAVGIGYAIKKLRKED